MEIALPYRDRKRPLWLLSLFVPILGLIGPALYLLVSPSEFWLWLSPLFFYFGIPLLDALIGEDPSNPPESEVPALEADPYYRWITYLLVPLLGGIHRQQRLRRHSAAGLVRCCGDGHQRWRRAGLRHQSGTRTGPQEEHA